MLAEKLAVETARQRVLDDFPYPVAYPYALVFDANQPASIRRWALCFTEYQLLRMVSLPLVGQYLGEPIDQTATDSIRALNIAVASIRAPSSPTGSTWCIRCEGIWRASASSHSFLGSAPRSTP